MTTICSMFNVCSKTVAISLSLMILKFLRQKMLLFVVVGINHLFVCPITARTKRVWSGMKQTDRNQNFVLSRLNPLKMTSFRAAALPSNGDEPVSQPKVYLSVCVCVKEQEKESCY